MLAIEFFINYTKLAMFDNKEEENKLTWNGDWTWKLFVIHSDAFLTELTWQVLIEGYLTSLLLDLWIWVI